MFHHCRHRHTLDGAAIFLLFLLILMSSSAKIWQEGCWLHLLLIYAVVGPVSMQALKRHFHLHCFRHRPTTVPGILGAAASKQIRVNYGSGTVGRIADGRCCICISQRADVSCTLTRWQHFSAWKGAINALSRRKCCHLVSVHETSARCRVMAAILKLWREIENAASSIDAYLRKEHSCQVSSRSDLKRRSLRLLMTTPTLRRFKSDRDETWQECASRKCTTDWVGFLMWRHAFKVAAMT